jgi:DNA-binding transcriptional ArsR family regulator
VGQYSTYKLINRSVEEGGAVDRLSEVFSALADPTRRAILARLAEGEATVNEIAEPFSMSLQAVSKHLKVLERAGLISRGKQAQWRPCRLDAEPLREVADWIAGYQRFWEERYAQLGEYLQQLQKDQTPDGGVT